MKDFGAFTFLQACFVFAVLGPPGAADEELASFLFGLGV